MIALNNLPEFGTALDAADSAALGPAAAKEVLAWLAACPAHVPTQMHSLPALARQIGVATIVVKDEGDRLGLGSFKALGGAYAVIRLVMDEAERTLGRKVQFDELQSDPVRLVAQSITVSCATDGNHGRSVAAGARIAGCGAVIFVHAGVSAARENAIASFGATVLRVGATYDESVKVALDTCRTQGWHIVSDTSWPGYEMTPLRVMQGYTAMVQEVLSSLDRPPTHVFLQAGVGGMAAAVAAHLDEVLTPDQRPRVLVVEPARAACLMASLMAGASVSIPHGLNRPGIAGGYLV